MAFELEALVGHLHVVGGRSISAAPPGLLVEVAPRRAARGREPDTFFVLVTPTDDVTAPAAFYDQMAQLSAERYFNNSGSVTAAIRSVFNSINQDLTDHNASGKRRYEASMLCAVLREDEIILARAGSSVAVVMHGGEGKPFPTEFSNDETLFGPPLGVHPVPDIKMSRFPVGTGSRLVISDARLADIESDKTANALAAADINEAINVFKTLVGSQAMLLVAEFVPPEAPSPVPVKEGRSTAKTPPKTESQTIPAVATTNDTFTPASTPLPEETIAPPKRERGPSVVQQGSGRIALRLSRMFGGLSRLFDRIMPLPAEGQRPWIKASTMTGITVMIPVGIVLLVMFISLGEVGNSEFELCVNEAKNAAETARSISSSDVSSTTAAWNAVIAVVRRCNDIRPGDGDMNALTREAQIVIDSLSDVERREANAILSLPNAVLNQIVVQGLDLYVLDSQGQQIYRVTLTENGRSTVPNSRIIIPAMRFGAAVGQYRINNLIDMAWSETTAQIMALDDKGILIQCSPRFLQSCEAQQLLAAERWVSPRNMVIWQGRMYLLDPGANQIWRYDSSGGTFLNTPIEYFSGDNRPDIRNAVDFGIDDNGSVYILTGNGDLTKWVSGQQNPFTFAGFPEGQQIASADAMFLDNNPIGRAIYIVSRSALSIYETSLAGTFSNSYRAFDEDNFAALSGVVADSNQQIVYALSGNSVFMLDKQAPPA